MTCARAALVALSIGSTASVTARADSSDLAGRAETARADSSDLAGRADALYQEGKALRREHYYRAARLIFEESRRLQDGIGVTLYVADCYQHEGELHEAVAEFRRAEVTAKERGDARETIARQHADSVEQELQSLDKPTAEAEAQTAAQTPTAQPADEPSPVAHAAAPSGAARPRQQWIGASFAGAGFAAVGLGAFFGVRALSKLGQSNAGPCVDDRCSAAGLALRQQAETAARWSTVAFIAGGASIAGGVVIYLTAPRAGGALAVAPMATAGGAGAIVQGTF